LIDLQERVDWAEEVRRRSNANSRGIGRATFLGVLLASVWGLGFSRLHLGWKWLLAIPIAYFVVTFVLGIPAIIYRLAVQDSAPSRLKRAGLEAFGCYFFVCVAVAALATAKSFGLWDEYV
jgi:hypothetical protein